MNGSRSCSGRCWTWGPSTIVERNSRACSGSLGRRAQPAARRAEARRPAGAPRSSGGAGVVPRRLEVAEGLGVGLAREHARRPGAQQLDVALPPALGHELAPRGQRAAQAREQPLVIGDPVKGRGREHGVDRLLQLELEQVADANHPPRTRPQPLARRRDHRLRRVEGDHPPARQPLEQRLGDAARNRSRRRAPSRRRAAPAGASTSRPIASSGPRSGRSSPVPCAHLWHTTRTLSRTPSASRR